jgi:hypothetical protein
MDLFEIRYEDCVRVDAAVVDGRRDYTIERRGGATVHITVRETDAPDRPAPPRPALT